MIKNTNLLNEFKYPKNFYSTFTVRSIPKYYLLRIQLTVSPTTKLRMLSTHNETVILNYIGGDPISHSLTWVNSHFDTYIKGVVHKKGNKNFPGREDDIFIYKRPILVHSQF